MRILSVALLSFLTSVLLFSDMCVKYYNGLITIDWFYELKLFKLSYCCKDAVDSWLHFYSIWRLIIKIIVPKQRCIGDCYYLQRCNSGRERYIGTRRWNCWTDPGPILPTGNLIHSFPCSIMCVKRLPQIVKICSHTMPVIHLFEPTHADVFSIFNFITSFHCSKKPRYTFSLL